MNRLRGEVSLESVKAQKEEKDRVKQELQKKSTNAVAALSEEELKVRVIYIEFQCKSIRKKFTDAIPLLSVDQLQVKAFERNPWIQSIYNQ